MNVDVLPCRTECVVVLPCRVEQAVVGVEWSGKGLGYDNG